jgi:hypothetical protein
MLLRSFEQIASPEHQPASRPQLLLPFLVFVRLASGAFWLQSSVIAASM